MSSSARALHFVLKVASLKENVEFFRDKLGMTVLRHEVFDEGCEAACNGPYANKWSKTMIGYGPEDNHFVLELTYNYSVGGYKLGNDLQHIKVALKSEMFDKISSSESNRLEQADTLDIKSPDGYDIKILRNDSIKRQDVTEVCLACSNLQNSLKYWVDLLKIQCYSINDRKTEASLRYSDDQATIKLRQIVEPIDRASAYGRVAYSCPSNDLKPIQAAVEIAKHKVLTPFLSLNTPGKATVQVVILADPDGHEICFVGDEGFRELSKIDPVANSLIEKSIADDKSDQWFKKRGKNKEQMS